VLAVALIRVMPEQGFTPAPATNRNPLRHMAATFGSGLTVVRGSRTLITIILLSAIFGAWSESYDRMGDIHFIQTLGLPGNMAPIVWFGLMSIIAMPIHLIVTEVARRRLTTTDQRANVRTLMALEALLVAAALTFALAGNVWVGYLATIVIGLVRSVSWPIRSAWLNQHVPSEVRATVFSMDSQANAIGQMTGGPLYGLIGNTSLRAALALGAVLLLPGQWLYGRLLKDGAGAARRGHADALPSVE
jgi:MFS transporter, DHA3 family, tetracycline resistance protein